MLYGLSVTALSERVIYFKECIRRQILANVLNSVSQSCQNSMKYDRPCESSQAEMGLLLVTLLSDVLTTRVT